MLRFATSNTTKALPSEGELFKLQRRPLCPRDGVTKRGREREWYIFSIQWREEKHLVCKAASDDKKEMRVGSMNLFRNRRAFLRL